MQFRLIGPVEIHSAGQVLEIGPPQLRLLAAALAVDAGRLVTVESLIDRIWDDAPAGARRTLHVLVSKMRRVLERACEQDPDDVTVVRRSGGYVLQLDPDRVDLLRFRRLAEKARQAVDAAKVNLLRAAVALWQGEPLSGLSGSWAARAREVWRQEYLEVAVAWARAELRSGDPAATIGALTMLAEEHPLAESVPAALMRALCAVGRPADALACYAQASRRLAAELGVDPGAELQAIYQATLRDPIQQVRTADPALAAADRAPAAGDQAGPMLASELPAPVTHSAGRATAWSGVVPRQLPAPPGIFVGREAELQALSELPKQARSSDTVVISALDGTAGVGKTALAVHWAHQVAAEFPDGQLYVNLRGFDPSAAPVAPGEALGWFLDALGVPPESIPASPEARTGLYRSLAATRQLLIVLDNARDEDQVRPLLPGSGGCLVLVTSRAQLAGLAVREGARQLSLDVLTSAEARQMLAARLPTGRAAAEPAAVYALAGLCARLPLALAITAARAVVRSAPPLADLAAELRAAASRLDVLDGQDSATSVRAVLSWSYDQLSPTAAQLFRLLGLHQGPDISVMAAASLGGISATAARLALAELTAVSLLAEHVRGRYAFHDLLRAYAADLVRAVDDKQARHAAVGRILDHYLHTTHAAALLINPARDPIIVPAPGPGVTPERLNDHPQALAWFEAEYQVLLGSVDLAGSTGADVHAWQIPWTMADFLDWRGHWHEMAVVQRTALAASKRLGDMSGQAASLLLLACACWRLGDYDQVLAHCAASRELYEQLGDLGGVAKVYIHLASAADSQGRYADALGCNEQALSLYQAINHGPGQARMLNNIGWCHALLGDYPRAREFCRKALALTAELGDRSNEAHAWDSLGYAEHHLGNLAEAADCYQRALSIFTGIGSRYYQAEILTHLGEARHAAGEQSQARDAWRQALDILNELDHPDASQVRAKLAGQPAPAPAR